MKRMCALLLLLFSMLLAVDSFAKEPDWSAYASVLSKYVQPGVKNDIELMVIDYQGIKGDPLFQQVIDGIEAFSPRQLVDKNEKLAFYINIYNIYAIKMVVDHLPLKSIKDVGSFFSPVWKKNIGQIEGKAISLDEIEHAILRNMGEPRIHMAIVCASVSCPDLRNEPYTAARLDEQLDDQAIAFLNHSGKGVKVTGNDLYISKIFDWFEKDFKADGGVKSFILKYRKDLHPSVRVNSYLTYDWNLNLNSN